MIDENVIADDDSDVGEITPSEILQSLSIPATFTNTIYPLHRSGIIRIAFGESVDEGTVFHSAVAMSVPVAKLLQRALADAISALSKDDE